MDIKTDYTNIENETFKITTVSPEYQFGYNHFFNVGLAQKFGINEAIILNHLIYWTQNNYANNRNIYDGYVWTYNSIEALQKIMPYFTDRQIRYALEKLQKLEIIKSGNYNKMKYDQTKWYAIIDKSILQNCQMELHELSNQSNKIVKPIPDNKTDSKTHNKTNDIRAVENPPSQTPTKKVVKQPVQKEVFGEYENIHLSRDEIKKLDDEYGCQKIQKAIDFLSEYKIEKNYKSKSDYLTIKRWVLRAVDERYNIKPQEKQNLNLEGKKWL